MKEINYSVNNNVFTAIFGFNDSYPTDGTFYEVASTFWSGNEINIPDFRLEYIEIEFILFSKFNNGVADYYFSHRDSASIPSFKPVISVYAGNGRYTQGMNIPSMNNWTNLLLNFSPDKVYQENCSYIFRKNAGDNFIVIPSVAYIYSVPFADNPSLLYNNFVNRTITKLEHYFTITLKGTLL